MLYLHCRDEYPVNCAYRRQIDVLIPSWERFLMLKHRKHITRTDMNQFRQQEVSVGMKGLLVNFCNGVDVRESTSLLPGDEKRELAKQKSKLRGRTRLQQTQFHQTQRWATTTTNTVSPNSEVGHDYNKLSFIKLRGGPRKEKGKMFIKIKSI